MPADRLLITLLRHLQTHTDQQDTPRLLSTASSLFTTLSNPNNLTLLTTQLLSANALWTRPSDLRSCLRFLGTFQSAAMAIIRHEDEVAEDPTMAVTVPGRPIVGGNLSRDEWVKAVISGADERSPRWRHLLVIAGLLIGYEAQDRQGLSRSLKKTVQSALTKAVNLALQDVNAGDEIGPQCIAMVLNYTFALLDDSERATIDYDRLLPVLIGSTFFSNEGYRSCYFLTSVEADVQQISDNKFSWSDRSPSFKQISDISSQPLVSNVGPLSRLIAHTVENLQDSLFIQPMMDDLEGFADILLSQWRKTKLSEVDRSEESIYFNERALNTTLPVLWKLLRSALYATTIILRSVLGRILGDRRLASDEVAPVLATQTLKILRSLYFISSRLGHNSLTEYTFVYLASIDILSSYPASAILFIESVRPAWLGQVSTHPLDRTLDLYFLNTAEHFTLLLSPQHNQELLIAAAAPYLSAQPNMTVSLLEIFEAAHSVTLSVLSAPRSAETDLTASHLPFYVGALFSLFPRSLSGRQFRLAFRTLARIANPPSPLADTHPDLAETLLELLHARAAQPPAEPRRPAPYTAPDPPVVAGTRGAQQDAAAHAGAAAIGDEGTDERTTVVLAVIDSLPFLPAAILDAWLPRAAALLQTLDAERGRAACRERFWQVLADGEMDVERSRLCVGWWGTRGGREMVLGLRLPVDEAQADADADGEHEGPFMSGALQVVPADGESKL